MWLVKPGFCVLLAAVSVITRVRPVRGASSDGSVTSSCLCLEKAVDELYNPVEYLAIRRRDSLLSLVVEQRGVIRAFLEDDRERQQVFMDITDRVTTNHTQGEERGLLSVALHPDYSQRGNGRLFAYYITTVSGQDYAYVSEFQVNNDVVDVTSERQLLRMKQLSNRGNGGQLLFGDDGYLYIFTGDGSGHDDLAGRAQDPRSFLGKALRVDVNKQRFEPGDSASAYLYDTPNSNISFGDREGRPEVFALGFRNPWRCSQDKKSRGGTGDIFCGDAGTDLFEEVNIVKEGRNYGWNLKEGTQCFNAANCSQLKDGEDPIYSYPHSPDWGNAVVGGFVYRGARFPALTGHYVFGDAVTGETFLLKKDGEGRWGSREWPLCDKTSCPCNARHTKLPFLLAFGLHTDGELMMMMSSEFSVLRPKGILFRVFPPSKPDKVPATCGSCCLTSTPVLSLIPAMVVSLVWHVLHACHVQLW